MAGVQMINVHPAKNSRIINITQAQITEICSREVLAKHAAYTLLERCAIYNELWKGQGCNLRVPDLSKFYKGSGITL